MQFFLTGQDKCDLSIQVTAWAGLTVFIMFVVNVTSNDRKMRNIFMGCLDV